ncbi:MAG TPA: SDR family oxidoreductase [Candidatus Rubrimentiphilum sp.]|nr:SDR family oxidoreductase [Candidatus Rubrimentiphilum sp.]
MKQAVLVTGASTGIGYATSALLARRGFTVFAGVRSDADSQRLSALPGVAALQLDVTDAEQIRDAAHAVHESGLPLRGVVNNAGIAVPGPLEFLPIDELRRGFDVNFFGALAVTQAFLPMLRAAKGRIVFMSSVSGQIAAPFVGAYSSSKFALESASDALRMELRGSGVWVSVVQPGNVNTPIWEKGRSSRNALMQRAPQEAHDYYAPKIETLLKITQDAEKNGLDPNAVAETVLHALTAKRPRARYAIGAPAGWMRRTFTLFPERLRDRTLMRRMGFE